MERYTELLNSISKMSGVNEKDIMAYTISGMFPDKNTKQHINQVCLSIDATTTLIDCYEAKRIQVGCTNVNYNREKNLKVIESNINSLKDFLEQLLWAEKKLIDLENYQMSRNKPKSTNQKSEELEA